MEPLGETHVILMILVPAKEALKYACPLALTVTFSGMDTTARGTTIVYNTINISKY